MLSSKVKVAFKTFKVGKATWIFDTAQGSNHMWHHYSLEYSENILWKGSELELAVGQRKTFQCSYVRHNVKKCFHTQASSWDPPWMLWRLGWVKSVVGQSVVSLWTPGVSFLSAILKCAPLKNSAYIYVKIFCSSIRLRFPSLTKMLTIWLMLKDNKSVLL